MLRLLHMADVHLGARHTDLGDTAATQRERQFAAFRRGVDAAIERDAQLVLVCGDLFDSNAQPRRSVERACGELKRLTDRLIRVVIIPGTHDCYERGSIYRVFDLRALAGLAADSDLLTVLTPERPDAAFADLDAVVYGRVFDTKRAPASPLSGFTVGGEGRGRWRIGMIHGSLHVPGKVEDDDVLFTDQEVAASGLDYLALGHWHSHRHGRAGRTTWAYAGAPEAVAVDQDGSGHVLFVTLDEGAGRPNVVIEPVRVGRTRFRKLDVHASEVRSQDDLVRRLRELADPDAVLDVRVVGVTRDGLDLHEEEIERELEGAFLKSRVRDRSIPALPDGPLPPPDTIAGAFIRGLQDRIAVAEAAGERDEVDRASEALHLGRLLLDDPQRVTLV